MASTESEEQKTTHFGFRSVPESEKEKLVRDVFSSVAASYDRMNDVMSFGIHRLWKDQFVSLLDPGRRPGGQPLRIIDVAGGTGDIAFRMLNWMTDVHNDHQSKVLITDINSDMLKEGEKRAEECGYGKASGRTEFLVQNAEILDAVEDNSMDLYTVAFGIRNFTNINAALETAYRVLKPGGIFACMEFSKVNIGILDMIYQQYSFNIIPLMGQLVAADRDSYQYLVESIQRFPSQEEFASMIKRAGFELSGPGYKNLTFGVAAIHTGVKPLVESKLEEQE
ncbi:UbiE/COQ5 methyltransferase [Dipodascopsis uninucleata]